MINWTKAKRFIETHCRQSKEPWFGKPIVIQPWQEDFLQPFFDDPNVKICSVWLGRKNGKSTIAGAVALATLLSTQGGEVYIVAATVIQAEHLFRQITDFIDLDPALKNDPHLWVRGHKLQIEYKKSILKILSTDPRRSSFNANLVICDELAEWGIHGREVWDKLTTGGIARVNSKILTLSTAQYNRHTLGYEVFQKACQARDNPERFPSWLPVVYSLPDSDDPSLPDHWWKCNPSAGITVPKEEYYKAWAETKDNPRELAKFQTFFLCQWVGSAERWIAPSKWAATETNIPLDHWAGSECVIGLDASSKHDLTAYSILIQNDGNYYLYPRMFIPEERALLKEKTDHVPYRAWASHGYVTFTAGERINHQTLIDYILADTKHLKVNAIVYDPYGLELARQDLEIKHNFTMIEVTPTPARLSAACGFFEREVLAKRLFHPANRCLDWNVENVAVKTVQDRVYLEKKKMTQRIDGVSASLLAIWYILENEQETGSIYDRQTITTF